MKDPIERRDDRGVGWQDVVIRIPSFLDRKDWMGFVMGGGIVIGVVIMAFVAVVVYGGVCR